MLLILPMICVAMDSCMMKEIRIPIYKQMLQLNIYQTYMEVWCKIKSIATRYNDKYVF